MWLERYKAQIYCHFVVPAARCECMQHPRLNVTLLVASHNIQYTHKYDSLSLPFYSHTSWKMRCAKDGSITYPSPNSLGIDLTA